MIFSSRTSCQRFHFVSANHYTVIMPLSLSTLSVPIVYKWLSWFYRSWLLIVIYCCYDLFIFLIIIIVAVLLLLILLLLLLLFIIIFIIRIDVIIIGSFSRTPWVPCTHHQAACSCRLGCSQRSRLPPPAESGPSPGCSPVLPRSRKSGKSWIERCTLRHSRKGWGDWV